MANSDWETFEKPRLMKRLLDLPRDDKIKLIKRAREYRSGTDSCNSVYMGSMAISMLCRALGGIYGNDDVDYLLTKASDHNLDTALNVCASYIKTMEQHPTKPCPCCGQIVAADAHGATSTVAARFAKAVCAMFESDANWSVLDLDGAKEFFEQIGFEPPKAAMGTKE
ncbi:hypothetical protein [Brucella intermedia]|uniref:hypothetical protein n=1 Tax=Brucella intermedia TaxID=94625 RepID=UPI00224B17C3|nr:hypothetical protein [Brucella intermedia]